MTDVPGTLARPASGTVDPREFVVVGAPFLVGSLLPFVMTAFWHGPTHPWATAAAAAVLIVTLLVATIGVVLRAPLELFMATGIAYLLVLVLARHGAGGTVTLIPLVLVPLLAVSLYGGPRALAICIVGIAATLFAPLSIWGAPEYEPEVTIPHGIVWVTIATIVGVTIRRLVRTKDLSELRYRSVFDSVRDIVFQIDPDGRWSLLNPAWHRVTGRDVDATIGCHFTDFVDPKYRADVVRMFETLVDGGTEEVVHEMHVQLMDGRERWLLVAARPSAKGPGMGVAGTITDVTDRHEAERLKEQFFALVSHELRTPLAAIIGYIELLRDEEGDRISADGRHFIAVMERNSQRLLRLIGDLLLSAQIEAGSLSLILRPVDVGDVVQAACDGVRIRAQDRNITITATTASDVPRIDADGDRLGQVVDNLLTNAIKFTPPEGSITVSTSLEQDAHGAPTVVIELSDTGDGIAPADQERLFERFVRSRSADEQAIQGVGLGLAISRAIVEAHGGRISVRSALGAGSTFRVELPVSDSTTRPETIGPRT